MRARWRALAADKRNIRWLAWQIGALTAKAYHAPKKLPKFVEFVGKDGVEATPRRVQDWRAQYAAAMAWDAKVKARERVLAANTARKRRGPVRKAKAPDPPPPAD